MFYHWYTRKINQKWENWQRRNKKKYSSAFNTSLSVLCAFFFESISHLIDRFFYYNSNFNQLWFFNASTASLSTEDWKHFALVLMKLFNRWEIIKKTSRGGIFFRDTFLLHSLSLSCVLHIIVVVIIIFSIDCLSRFHRKWIGFLFSFAFFWHSHR